MSKNTPERHDVYCDKQYPMIKKIVCNVLEYKKQKTYIMFNGFSTAEYSKTRINKELQYLGKPNCKFIELFEVQK